MDRAMEGGIDDVGLRRVVRAGAKYRYEFAGLLMHAEHLEAVFTAWDRTPSVSRVSVRADDIDPSAFDNGNRATIPLQRSWPVSASPFLTPA